MKMVSLSPWHQKRSECVTPHTLRSLHTDGLSLEFLYPSISTLFTLTPTFLSRHTHTRHNGYYLYQWPARTIIFPCFPYYMALFRPDANMHTEWSDHKWTAPRANLKSEHQPHSEVVWTTCGHILTAMCKTTYFGDILSIRTTICRHLNHYTTCHLKVS